MPPLTDVQKRTDRIYKLTQALVEMGPKRRRGDVAVLNELLEELEILRARRRDSAGGARRGESSSVDEERADVMRRPLSTRLAQSR